jgi:hypothetical protein
MVESASKMRFALPGRAWPEPQPRADLEVPTTRMLGEGTPPPIFEAGSSAERSSRLEMLRAALARATSPPQIANALLAQSAWIGRRGVIFLNVRGELRGWSGRGRGVTAATLSSPRLAIDRPSVLGYLAATPASYRGRIQHDVRSRSFLIDTLSTVPDEITAFSITARGRVIGVAYADGVFVAMSGFELARLGAEVGEALARARWRQAAARPKHDERISH